MPAAAIGAAAAPIVGGLIGNLMSQKDRNNQKKLMQQAMAELEAVGYPPDLSKEIIYSQFEQVGILTPQLEEDLSSTLAPSQVASITEDPALRQAQTSALSQLQQRGKVGLSAEDRASLNTVRNEVQRDAQAKQGQILQQMQARGMGGSGAELIAQLQAGQAGADRASAESDSLMSMAQQRALQALNSSADLASGLRTQDFGIAADKARAVDERNKFLLQNSVARQTNNTNRLNQAQQLNLAEQQRIADANNQMANQEQLRQVSEQGNLYDRSLGYAGAKANAMTGQANFAGQQAANTANMYSGLGSAVGAGVSAYGQYQNQQAQNDINNMARNGLNAQNLQPDAAGGTTGYSRYYMSDKNLKEDVDHTDEAVNAFLTRLTKKIKEKK